MRPYWRWRDVPALVVLLALSCCLAPLAAYMFVQGMASSALVGLTEPQHVAGREMFSCRANAAAVTFLVVATCMLALRTADLRCSRQGATTAGSLGQSFVELPVVAFVGWLTAGSLGVFDSVLPVVESLSASRCLPAP